MARLDLLRPGPRGAAEAIGERFAAAEPFRHAVVDDFLDEAFCRELIAEFPAFDAEHALNEFGEVGGKAVREDLPGLGPAYARLDGLLRDPEFLRWLSRATGVRDLLYDPEYVGGGAHDNVSGQELDPHVDFNYHPRTRLHRRLNLILFLNPEWEESWGGCLQLHLNPWAPAGRDHVRTVVPKANRCVLFETTERSWHGFPRIAAPPGVTRRSVAVYYYTAERPPEETFPEHSTYYVQRPLPERIVPGRVLTADDVAEIQRLMARRDRQVRGLWDTERELRAFIAKIERSPTYRLSRALAWPLKKLRRLAR